MKIIDAHFHLFPPDPRNEERARAVGHENSVDHLRQVYGELGMVHGVIMGNHSLDPAYHDYPADLFHYCVGLDSSLMRGELPADYVELVEENLKRESCCGVKLYPGYNRVWLSDPIYEPIYALADRYDKPVAIHMGQTVFPAASLKYAHPLVLDEVAADHPRVRFVMCHFGNPFLESAAAVVEKNPNVCTDLSGLLEGRFDLAEYLTRLGATPTTCAPGLPMWRSGTASSTAPTGPSSTWGSTSPSSATWSPRSTGRRSFLKTPTASTAWGCKRERKRRRQT